MKNRRSSSVVTRHSFSSALKPKLTENEEEDEEASNVNVQIIRGLGKS